MVLTISLSALIGLQVSAGSGMAFEGENQQHNQTPEIVCYPQDAAQHNIPPEVIKRFLPTAPDAFVQKDIENGKLKLVAWTKYLNKPDKIWASRIQLISMKNPQTPKICWESEEEELYQPEIITRPDWVNNNPNTPNTVRNAGAAVLFVEPLVVENGKVVRLEKYMTEKLEVVKVPGTPRYELVMHDRENPNAADKATTYKWTGKTFASSHS